MLDLRHAKPIFMSVKLNISNLEKLFSAEQSQAIER